MAEAIVVENPTGGLWDMTVTDLRLMLKEKGLPIYGNKKDLIERYESAETEGNSTEAPAEETVEEVEDDATGSE